MLDFGELLVLVGGFLLLVGEVFVELDGQVLCFGKDPQPLARAVLNRGGVGSEKRRSRGGNFAAVHHEIQRQMMSLHSPAPFGRFGRFAKNCEIVILRIADRPFAHLLLSENGFQTHYGGGFLVSLRTGAGRDERQGGLLLRCIHFFQRQTLAVFQWNEMPIDSFLVVEVKGRLGLLLRVQSGEELFGRAGHLGSRRLALLTHIGHSRQEGKQEQAQCYARQFHHEGAPWSVVNRPLSVASCALSVGVVFNRAMSIEFGVWVRIPILTLQSDCQDWNPNPLRTLE